MTAVLESLTSSNQANQSNANSNGLPGSRTNLGFDANNTSQAAVELELAAMQELNPSKKRRLVANARERNRVHTISAAFEAVRQQIPCYIVNQKMSKLSILKVATAYIKALAAIIEEDDLNQKRYKETGNANFDNSLSNLALNECTQILKQESRTKKKGLR